MNLFPTADVTNPTINWNFLKVFFQRITKLFTLNQWHHETSLIAPLNPR